MKLNSIVNASGGLIYHWRALHRRRMWSSHLENTRRWLSAWTPHEKQLVLIGPSAGYSLSEEFLHRFHHIVAIDPDPTAKLLFRLRHPNVNFSWSQEDFLTKNGRLWSEGLYFLLDCYPNSSFLFCNIIGQLPLLVSTFEKDLTKWAFAFQTFRKSAQWASYHDSWSVQTKVPPENRDFIQTTHLSIEDSLKKFWTKGLKEHVVDHLTQNLFAEYESKTSWIWQIGGNDYRCVEGVLPSKQDI